MTNITLSYQADKIFGVIYQEYLIRKSNNIPNIKASYFEVSTIYSLFSNIETNDIILSLIELSKNHLIRFFTDGSVIINSYATFYMKNKNKNVFKEIKDF